MNEFTCRHCGVGSHSLATRLEDIPDHLCPTCRKDMRTVAEKLDAEYKRMMGVVGKHGTGIYTKSAGRGGHVR